MNFSPRLDVLPEPQQILWPDLAQVPKHFVLYGGTALALRLGHRQSVDFDFFSDQKIEPEKLMKSLPMLKGAKILDSQPNTLTVLVGRNGPVKISFFGGLTFGRICDPEWTNDKVICVASLLDVGALKMNVILNRSEAKDYLDIYALLKNGWKLPELLGAACALHEGMNPIIPLRALSYFEDGDLRTLSNEIKDTLTKAAGATCVGEIPTIAKLPGGISPAI